ncbi:N-acetyl-glucosamine transferase [Pilimelia anulata]|uniref:N-acetyl-glucosamine transferase n=1 Tax=Pilimelia anulata TaxID=53371 RepID=A0A8J3B3H9_9ACTN|nr:glycosyltransferase family 2 protein [Pilimelia anulata]GGJ79866.1 N-acetyl-glucosamine transferase [Pilimelia anulata]
MTATHGWLLVVVSHAILLAWPALTVVLAGAAGRYSAVRTRDAIAELPDGGASPRQFWIVVPALNEEVVVANTVNAALRLRGPVDTLVRVLVIDDGSDDRTPEILGAIDHPRLTVLRRDLPEARQGKGEALNAAYRLIAAKAIEEGVDPQKVVLGIIDGDGQGSPNLLIEVSRRMRDPKVGAVQCQVRIRNRGKLLGAVQDLEFGAVVNAFQRVRDSLDTVGLGGNGQFTRLGALLALGDAPWSACLVEDLELGLRMHLSGLSIRYTPRASVTQQAVVDVRRLTRQRTRWAQGNIQCARYLLKLVTSTTIRPRSLAEMLHYLLSPWANAILTAILAGMTVAGVAALAAGHPIPYLPTWWDLGEMSGVWLAATLFPGFVWTIVHRRRLGDESIGRLFTAALAYPAFLILGLVATYRAVFRHLAGRQTWAKTERLTEELTPQVIGTAGPLAVAA